MNPQATLIPLGGEGMAEFLPNYQGGGRAELLGNLLDGLNQFIQERMEGKANLNILGEKAKVRMDFEQGLREVQQMQLLLDTMNQQHYGKGQPIGGSGWPQISGQTSQEAQAGQQGLMERATPPVSLVDKLMNPQRGTLPMFLLPEDQRQAFLSQMGMALAGMTAPLGGQGGKLSAEALKRLETLRAMDKSVPPVEKSQALLLEMFDKLMKQMDKIKGK